MNWFESHLVQLMYWLDGVSRIMPLVLTAAVIFIFFLVRSFGRRAARMEFYLDRIDNHLREITYFIKEHQAGRGDREVSESGDSGKSDEEAGRSSAGRGEAQRLRE